MRNIAKTDDNHTDIVKAFRSVPGCLVKDTSRVGGGFPDIVVGFRGVNYLVEIKLPNVANWRSKLNPAQVKFHSEWTGQVIVVRTNSDVWNLLGL